MARAGHNKRGKKTLAAPPAKSRTAVSWLCWILFALSLWPLFFASHTSITGDGGVPAAGLATTFILALAGSVAALWLLAGGVRVQRVRLFAAAGGLLLVFLVSAVVSGRGLAGFLGESGNHHGWLVLVAMAALALFSTSRSDTLAPILRLSAPFVSVALCVAWYLIAGPLGGGTLGHSTNLGIVLLMLLPWVAPREGDSMQRSVGGWAVLLLSLAVMALTGARVALLVSVTCAILLAFQRLPLSRVVKLAAVGVVVLASIVLMLTIRPQDVAGVLDPGSLGGRPEMLRLSWLATLERPLMGWGPDGFAPGAAAISTADAAQRGVGLMNWPSVRDPHNIVAWVMTSGGLLGLLLFIWLAAELVLHWRVARGEPDVADAAMSVAAVVAVLLTAPMPIHAVPLFALVIGMSISGASIRDRENSPTRFDRAFAFTLAVACVLLALLSAVRYSALRQVASGDPAVVAGADSFAGLIRYDGELWSYVSKSWGFAYHNRPDADIIAADVRAARQAVAADSTNPHYALELARVLLYFDSSQVEVDAAFEEALRRMEYFPQANLEYAVHLGRTGRIEQAKRQLAIGQLQRKWAWAPPTEEFLESEKAAQELIAGGAR